MADLSSLLGGSFGATPQGISGPLGSAGSGSASGPFNNIAPPPSWMSETFQPTGPQNTQTMGQTLAGGFGGFSPPAPTGNAGYVASLYQDMYGRAPDTAGWGYWTNAMNSGMSANDLQNQFRSSQEYKGISNAGAQQMGTGGADYSQPARQQSKGVNFGGNGGGFNMQQLQPYLPLLMQLFSGVGGLGGLGGYGNSQANKT